MIQANRVYAIQKVSQPMHYEQICYSHALDVLLFPSTYHFQYEQIQ
jgi:hypothetical protein